jgi:hypothetical protein
MTAPTVQEEDHEQGVQLPNFQDLQEQIKEALAAYKQRQGASATIRESLSKARKQEADCLQRSLTDDDPKLVKRIAESRVEIEVQSRRLTVAEESLAGGLESVARPMRRLQSMLIQEIANLRAERTKAHYEVIARELDPDATDRFSIGRGLGRGQDLLWRLASLGSDVVAFESLHPHLTWLHTNGELTLQKLEGDVALLFKAVGPVLEQIES